MTADNQKPTVLFVHGAWHTNEAFAQVQGLLSQAGYGIKNVQLASSAPDGPWVQGISEDVEVVQSALSDLVETGADIIVVMHSYGGVIGSSAAQGFSKEQRREKNLKGGIVHLVYISAVVIDEGVSLKDGLGGQVAPWANIHGEDTYMTSHENARDTFYNDLSEEEAQKWISKLYKHATKSLSASATWAGWKHIPSTYVLCGQDHAIPAEAQEMMINRDSANFNVVRFEHASHSPFLSMPKETADVIRKAAGEVV